MRVLRAVFLRGVRAEYLLRIDDEIIECKQWYVICTNVYECVHIPIRIGSALRGPCDTRPARQQIPHGETASRATATVPVCGCTYVCVWGGRGAVVQYKYVPVGKGVGVWGAL